MPRQPRLDAQDTLHYVMVRGLERRAIFRDDPDRADFVARLATLAAQGALSVYAWALLPNHAHLLVRTGTRPLARSMRRLLTGYAGAFNRRHKRIGGRCIRTISVSGSTWLCPVIPAKSPRPRTPGSQF